MLPSSTSAANTSTMLTSAVPSQQSLPQSTISSGVAASPHPSSSTRKRNTETEASSGEEPPLKKIEEVIGRKRLLYRPHYDPDLEGRQEVLLTCKRLKTQVDSILKREELIIEEDHPKLRWLLGCVEKFKDYYKVSCINKFSPQFIYLL
jgi:hypothetical protein